MNFFGTGEGQSATVSAEVDLRMNPKMAKDARAIRRIEKELEKFRADSTDTGLVVDVQSPSKWHISFTGAEGTVYEGEKYTLQVRVYIPVCLCLSHRVSLTHSYTHTHPLLSPNTAGVLHQRLPNGVAHRALPAAVAYARARLQQWPHLSQHPWGRLESCADCQERVRPVYPHSCVTACIPRPY